MVNYIMFLNLIKLGLKRKRNYIYVINNTKNMKLLKLLLKYNIVIGYKLIHKDTKNTLIKIFLNLQVKYYQLKNIYKPTNKRVLTYKDIQKLNNLYTKSIYIFSKSKGLINISECIKYQVSGILVFKLL